LNKREKKNPEKNTFKYIIIFICDFFLERSR